MSDNPFVKPLKAFDPKKNLNVNEKFKPSGNFSQSDTLSDLEGEDYDGGGSSAGTEFSSMKTSGPVTAGIIKIENKLNKNIFLVSNKSGDVYLVTPEQNTLKTIMHTRVNESIISTPSYSNGILYCTTREGSIYAINTKLGSATDLTHELKPEVIWEHKMKKGILTAPIATGKILIVASLGGIFAFEAYYQDDANKAIGKPLWGKSFSGIVSTPNIESGTMYIGSEDNNFYALDYGGNKVSKTWEYQLSEAARSKPCLSQKNDYVLIPTMDGFVYCLDRHKGVYKWNFVVKAPVYSNIISAIIEDKEYYFFGADNGIFYCLNEFGKKVWVFKSSGKIRTEALINDGKIYFGSEGNNFYSLNLRNGKQVFSFPTDGNINGKPVISDEIVYFGSSDSFVHGVHL